MSDEMFLNWHAALTRALLRYGLELGAQWPGGINHVCDQYHQEYGSSVYASLLGLWICCKEIKIIQKYLCPSVVMKTSSTSATLSARSRESNW